MQGAVSLTQGKGFQLMECAVQPPTQSAPHDLHALGTIIATHTDTIITSRRRIVDVLWPVPRLSTAANDGEDTDHTSAIVADMDGEMLWVHEGAGDGRSRGR